MKRVLMIMVIAVFAVPFLMFTAPADVAAEDETDDTAKKKIKHGPHFVDKDGDGYNDLAPDHDGDGIPNGQDPDWKGPGKGKGYGHHKANCKGHWKGKGLHGRSFVDKNNDGYNDLAPDHDGDGIPNGRDEDYKPGMRKGPHFIDADGDGICDHLKKDKKPEKESD